MNPLKIVLSQFNQTCMLLMEYPSIEEDGMTDYSKQTTWNLLNAYIYAHSQRSIYEYPEKGLEAITRLQSQCANMTFSDKNIYNRQFQKVVHKWGESAIKYIEIFENAKDLEVSVGNSYYEDQLILNILDNIQQEGKYLAQIASHQSELSKEEQFVYQKYLYLSAL